MVAGLPSASRSSWSTRPSRHVVPILLWPIAMVMLVVSLVTSCAAGPSVAPPAKSSSASPSAAGSSAPSPAPAAPKDASPSPKRSAAAKAKLLSLPRSSPVRLVIPEISVNAPFTDLAIGSSGQLDPPPADNANLVGWFAAGPSPGEIGTSIIGGHFDTKTSPAVFVELSELKRGSRFSIRRADGTIAEFVVDSVESFRKDNFPNKRVYADTATAQVRLITCGGAYDRAAKDYTENVVVFAHLDSATPSLSAKPKR